jgi:hypothetical protein
VKPSIISSNASNWVDQGHPPHRIMRRVLAYFLDRHSAADETWLDEHANTIVGMVAAEANEVEVGNYVRSLERETDEPRATPADARLVGIALWHIAKAALVRDFAERVLQDNARTKLD